MFTVLVRRGVVVPAGSRFVTVSVLVDNNAEVFWNGTLLGTYRHEGCVGDEAVFEVPQALVTPGTNLLAVRGIDLGSQSYLDVKVTSTASAPIAIGCTSSGQQCTPAFEATVMPDPGKPVIVSYTVVGHCSPSVAHLGLNGREVALSPEMGWVGGPPDLPLTYSFPSLGVLPTEPARLQLALDGRMGGCNDGTLVAWEGTFNVSGATILSTGTAARPVS
jgi:hypothetical protein